MRRGAGPVHARSGGRPAEAFDTGIVKTVQWYLDNSAWVADVQSGAYKDWIGTNYGGRA